MSHGSVSRCQSWHAFIIPQLTARTREDWPGELPIEFPTQMFLSINLRTAKVLGITIEPMLLARADEIL